MRPKAHVVVWSTALLAITLIATDDSPRPLAPLRLEAPLGQPIEVERARPRVQVVKIKQAKPFDRPDEARQFFIDQRLGLGASELPVQHLHDVRDRLRQRRIIAMEAMGGIPPGGILGWGEVGPGNIGGRTRSLVIDPTNTDIMYAGGVAGGVWKSTDGGASWLPTDDQMENLAIATIAMHPTDPNILYAGTGEGFGSGSFRRGLGIFKTVDGGASWTQLAATDNAGFHWVNKIVISHNNPSHVYAGTRNGVWRSTDSGSNWSLVLGNPAYQIAPFTSNGSFVGCTDVAIRTDVSPDVLYAAFGSFQADGLFRSADGGASWTDIVTPSYQGRMSIAIAPSDQDRVYLTMADNGGLTAFGRIVSIFRADDGVTFNSVLDLGSHFGPWLMSYSSIATGCVEAPVIYSQGWYDNIIQVDPVDSDVVWVGGIDLFRSDDAGVTFGMSGYWFYYADPSAPTSYLHPDQHMVVFDPNYDGVTNQTLYATNDGGLFRTTNARAATTQEECPIDSLPGPPPDIVWERLNNGYGVTQYYHGDAGQASEMYVGGSQDNGTSQGLSSATPNDWRIIFGGDGGYVAINPNDSDELYVEYQGFPTIQKSVDGGDNFVEVINGITDNDGLFINPFAMDPIDPDILWSGGSRPWRTTNGAALWEVAGGNFPGANNISAIAIAPSDHNVVYMGFSNGYVARSTNALAPSPTWQVSSSGLPVGAWVSSVAVDPGDIDRAYVTFSNYGVPHVFRTVDGGANWTILDGAGANAIPNIPAHWIAIRECNTDQLYVGTELGVFASDDGGATWDPSSVGLPNTVVETLDFPDPNTLVAFTYGRGVFKTALVPCGLVDAPLAGIGQGVELAAGPSPSRGGVTIRASLPRGGTVQLTVMDASGRQVAVLENGHRQAGMLTYRWDGRHRGGGRAAPGVYFVRLLAGNAALSQKVVMLE